MRVLFDQGTPAPLRRALTPHEVSTAFELGWSNLENGDLLRAAEGKFEVFVTTDKNLRYQQNLGGRQLAGNPAASRWSGCRRELDATRRVP